MPDSLLASLAVAFTLGLRHGFDPDHLAAIDALTRRNQTHRPAIARWCGSLFSLGHGTVVGGTGIAFAVGALFAVSFDTASQATLFAAYALPRDPDAAWRVAAWLGAAFTAGMLATDGVNGWWMARLIGRSDRRALLASRIMGLAAAAMALGIALTRASDAADSSPQATR